MTLEIALDTSAFAHLLDGASFEASHVCEAVRSRDAQLLVPSHALLESIDNRGEATTVRRHGRLQELVERLGPDGIRPLPLLGDFVHLEKTRRVSRNLETSHAQRRWWIECLRITSDANLLREWRERGGPAVERMLGKEDWARRNALVAEDVKKLDGHLDMPRLSELRRDFASNLRADPWALEALQYEPAAIRRVIADPAGHRASVAFAALAQFAAFAAFVRVPVGDALSFLNGDQNDWIDANIAASSAWCDVIVADDKNLRCRLRFLRQVGLYFAQPMTLAAALPSLMGGGVGAAPKASTASAPRAGRFA